MYQVPLFGLGLGLGLGLGIVILKVINITFRAGKVKTCKKTVLAREIVL
jgi:hypothetical protein